MTTNVAAGETAHTHDGARKLVMMANQIGTFFQSQGADQSVSGTADHIRKFWDPRMRKTIFAHLDAGGEGLTPNVRAAIETLRKAEKTS